MINNIDTGSVSYPKVIDIFRIIIDFIWNVISYPIKIGDGWQITIFHVIAFVWILIALIAFITLEIPKFSAGFDSYGKFSVKQRKRKG